MWVLHVWFLAAIMVLFLIASSFFSLFLSAGRRVTPYAMVRHTTYAFLASLVVFLHSGVHQGFLDSLIAFAGGKNLLDASIMAEEKCVCLLW
jgi:hypothetical protein